MSEISPLPTSLADWLVYIEQLHPKGIAMGLGRVQEIIWRLDLNPNFPIITVAGTNGKGSTCAILSQIYAQAGYRVGMYTSPHIVRYNERVQVNGVAVDDDALCQAFAAVEAVRGEIALTYFEMGTLAAIWYFVQQNIQIAVLEIGLGGRLDAVNAFEPDCAIVTSVDLDHMEYLGDTREKIGLEKAGVYRPQKPAICGDEDPPQSLCDYAKTQDAQLQRIGHEFKALKTNAGWRYKSASGVMDLPRPNLRGDFQLNNAACAIHAVLQLADKLPVSKAHIEAALGRASLSGRFQPISQQPLVIVDVAHNPHAARALAHNLQSMACQGRTLAVFAMLADKDINAVIAILAPYFSAWYAAGIQAPRGESAAHLKIKLDALALPCQAYETVEQAYHAAYQEAGKNDRIIVFGSFYTVAAAMACAQESNQSLPH